MKNLQQNKKQAKGKERNSAIYLPAEAAKEITKYLLDLAKSLQKQTNRKE